MTLEHTSIVVAASGAGQDRVAIYPAGGGVVIVLADGAGGTGNGARAAQAIVDAIAQVPWDAGWVDVLEAIDVEPGLHGGEATAVVVHMTETDLRGASAGDSGAWWITADAVVDLTAAQIRKPLVGAGAMPVAIHLASLGAGTLLVASDGLLRYASEHAIAQTARGEDLARATQDLVELVRLPTGGLQDDVSIVLCRSSGALSS